MRIALLSTEDDGLASPELLKVVNDVIQSDSVRVLTDTVEVVPCTITDVAVKAKVWLYPETLGSVLDTAQTQFEEAFNSQKSLGWDVTKSWIHAHLFVEGIQNIKLENPLEDIAVADDACAALKSCELTLEGRAW